MLIISGKNYGTEANIVEMPTIFCKNGFYIRIYPNDHSPPHVHVIKGRGQAKISIDIDQSTPTLLRVEGMTPKEAKQALILVMENAQDFLKKWKEIHG